MEPTIMKQLNFKKIFLNLLWPLLPFTAQAQENNTLYSILSKDNILLSPLLPFKTKRKIL